MKRHSSDSSDQGKNAAPRKSTDQNSINGNENSSSDSDSSPEKQTASDSITSENQYMPSTTVQSFPTYAYANQSQMMMQNQMMMYNTMRSFPWPDSCMFPVSVLDNMSARCVNIAKGKNKENGSSTSSHSYESELQIQINCNSVEMGQPLSPTIVAPYSDEEATAVMEKLRNEETFRIALHTLSTWLEKYEFNKGNVLNLFNMIQLTQNNVFRLMNTKTFFKEEEDFEKKGVNEKLKRKIPQLQEICNVFEITKRQKVWDQFTKNQRKCISTWIEEGKQLMSSLTKQVYAGYVGYDETEDDSSEKSPDNSDSEQAALTEEYRKLREELDSVRNQLTVAQDNKAALQNEVFMEKCEFKKTMLKLNEENESVGKEIESLKAFLREANNADKKKSTCKSTSKANQHTLNGNSVEENVSKEDVALVSVIGAFLHVHPFGASVEYICSYLKNVNYDVDCRYAENLMSRFPKLFRAETKGVGASLTKEWIFLGYEQKEKEH